jgi:hypothetical protein
MWRLDHAAYFFIALTIGALFAFWPPYLSRLPNDDVHAHVHAMLAVTWCGLLIAQPLLVRRHRALHRRLGAISKVIAPLFVASTILLTHHRFAIMSAATFAEDPAALYLGLIGTVLFSASYVLALRHRLTSALHGRFMIATGLTMIDPVFVRVLGYYGPSFTHPLMYQVCGYGLTDLLIALLLWRPMISARDRRLFAAGVAIFPVAHVAWFTVVQGPLWVPFAYWFRSLPLP